MPRKPVGAGRGAAGATTLEQVIRARILRLLEPDRRLLRVLAVAGQPLHPAAARHAAGLEGDDGGVERLRSEHLIRTRSSQDRDEIEPYHDRIREAVVAQLSPEELRAEHRKLALALEGSRSTDPEALALHFQEAGEPERAAEYAAIGRPSRGRGPRLRSGGAALPARARAAPLLRRETRAGGCSASSSGTPSSTRDAERKPRRPTSQPWTDPRPTEALELQRRAAEQYLIERTHRGRRLDAPHRSREGRPANGQDRRGRHSSR